MKKESKFGIINLLALCVLVAVLSIVPTIGIIAEEYNGIKDNFFGQESELQGVLVIWNVDTFEAGSNSKESFLNDISIAFAKANKGVYVLVENLSITELEFKLQAGETPDVFSFGFGLGRALMPYLNTYSLDYSMIRDEVVSSGFFGDKLLAIGYMLGGYGLFSTTDKLIDANLAEDASLSANINNGSFELKLRKSTKLIESTIWGEGTHTNAYNVITQNGLSIESSSSKKQDGYTAYVDFVVNDDATMLLGTQRDLARLSNREKLGKTIGLKFEPLGGFSDQVQYFGISNRADELRLRYAQDFVEYALQAEVQQKLSTIGMFSCNKSIQLYDINEFPRYQLMETKLKERLVIPKLFDN